MHLIVFSDYEDSKGELLALLIPIDFELILYFTGDRDHLSQAARP